MKLKYIVMLLCMTAGVALADSAKSISINFSGSPDSAKKPTDVDFSGVSGSGLYGALPVVGDSWNNFQTHWSGYGSSVERSRSIRLGDGTIAQGVSAAWDTSCNYSIVGVNGSAAPNNIFHSFLDDAANQKIEISGLTADNGFPATCTVYIYCSSDRAKQNVVFAPKTVNGVTYTYADGEVKEGTGGWGSYSYAQSSKLVLGGDYLKIENVPLAEGKVTIEHYGDVSTSPHGAIAAVQLDFGGTSDYALSVNFSGGQN